MYLPSRRYRLYQVRYRNPNLFFVVADVADVTQTEWPEAALERVFQEEQVVEKGVEQEERAPSPEE